MLVDPYYATPRGNLANQQKRGISREKKSFATANAEGLSAQ